MLNKIRCNSLLNVIQTQVQRERLRDLILLGSNCGTKLVICQIILHFKVTLAYNYYAKCANKHYTCLTSVAYLKQYALDKLVSL